MYILLLFINLVYATDYLIFADHPVTEDPSITVVTYFREQSDSYYYTIVYRFKPLFEKYKTTLTFTSLNANLAHRGSCRWSIRVYHESKRAGLDLPIEGEAIFPFDPYDTPNLPIVIRTFR